MFWDEVFCTFNFRCWVRELVQKGKGAVAKRKGVLAGVQWQMQMVVAESHVRVPSIME